MFAYPLKLSLLTFALSASCAFAAPQQLDQHQE